MSWLLPLPVVIPLIAAALGVALGHVVPSWLQRTITLLAVLAALGFSVVLLLHSGARAPIEWFGGWRPRGSVAIGIAFVAGPIGAAFAVLACFVTAVALVYSLSFVAEENRNFGVLVCVLCGAVCGFGLSGDLFNMFVWLELLGVVGYALTGFDIRRMSALQGAVNFAVVNTVGGYLLLVGVALLYARTGALNLAQIGQALAHGQAGGVVVVAMALVFCGFLCKAAVVPFHFWLADAYAVAPAPVCLIFAGVVTDIGLVGVARLWFTVFQAPFALHERIVGDTLLWLGIVTALVGGAMALVQEHLKRLLAFSVVCHIGIMLAGVALLSTKGVAGAATMLLAHGLATGGLFLAAGLLATRKPSRWSASLWFAGALALVGPPYVGVYMGHSLIDDAAAALGRQWVQPLLWLAGALAGAALLRAGVEVFTGLGADAEHGIDERRDADSPVLGIAAASLVVLGFATSLVPGLEVRAEAAAERFRDRAAYARHVLDGTGTAWPGHLPVALLHTSVESLAYGCGALAVAVGLAAFSVWSPKRSPARVFEPAIAGLQRLQTGVVGDYVMWVVVGTAVLGGVWALTLR